MDALRGLVGGSRKAVRIVGLSGIGKTRLAQALFEKTGVGEPLPASWAIYTDVGQEPDPLPLPMLETLIASNAPAILIVDNCPPETHRVLAERFAKSDSKLRLITIEYDVRDDRPEETEVVRIEAEGPAIVEALIRRRYPDRATVDARRLADLALGNARLALALAAAAPESGSLSTFDDDALFKRLFWQGEQPDLLLEQSAEALSLVYSIDVEGNQTPDELAFLSDLTGIPRLTLYRASSTLVGRGLAQVRGRWRAVLPHALANRLARRGLRSLPWRDLATAFAHPGAPRLRRSFARRLAYLHGEEDARKIVLHWMQPGGPLCPSQDFAKYDLDLLERVVHLVPDKAMESLAQWVDLLPGNSSLGTRLDQITRLLVCLTHSPAHFDNAVAILVKLALRSEAASADRAIENLFALYLSGTLAHTDQRIEVARSTLSADDPGIVRRGLAMLRAALKTSMWSPCFIFMDDARPDALGWVPRDYEVVAWFGAWLALAERVALETHDEYRGEVSRILADAVSRIWPQVPQLQDQIEAIAGRMNEQSAWVEGWNALKNWRGRLNTYRAADPIEQRTQDRLLALIRTLEPKKLLDRTRAVLRSKGFFDEAPRCESPADREEAEQQHSAKLRAIGQELAGSPEIIEAVGPELFMTRHNNPIDIGIGLGAAVIDARPLWRQLRDNYLSAPEQSRKTAILSGFLRALDERLPDVADEIRSECLCTPMLRQNYAAFAPSDGRISESELERLKSAARDPEVWAGQFERFVWSKEYGLADAERVQLLTSMLAGKMGPDAVIEALSMLRHVEMDSPRDWPKEICEIGIDAVTNVLSQEPYGQNGNLDYALAEVVRKCLVPDDEASAERLVDEVVGYAERRFGYLDSISGTVTALAELAPRTFLDRTFASTGSGFCFNRDAILDASPLARVEAQALIDWCQEGGAERWTAVAEAINPFTGSAALPDEPGSLVLAEQVEALLAAAPNAGPIVSMFFKRVAPQNWSGSRSAIMEQRIAALEQLSNHPDGEVRRAFDRCVSGVRKQIARERESEQSEGRRRDIAFE